VVRRQSRGSGELLRLRVQEFARARHHAVWRRRTRAQGIGHDGSFLLDGQQFTALNGGPNFQFTPAISFVVNCETQADVDEFWAKLTAGGTEGQCGWLTDSFGVSWQVVPAGLMELLKEPDPQKSKPVMQALMQMKRLDLATLQRARDQA
jgi:predicted 3-demethylubiquinone-9 3-methyltransferase (glyoxalase superfamily)